MTENFFPKENGLHYCYIHFMKKSFGLFRWAFLLEMAFCLFSLATPSFAGTERHFPQGAQQVFIANQSGVRKENLTNITNLAEKSIAEGYYPGAVILVTHQGKVIYKGVFGNRTLDAQPQPMTFDTIFDLASLTKVIVTTTAIMQFVEEGKIELDAPVANYWSAFANNGKDGVTVRELLTHTSGFQAILPTWVLPDDKKDYYASGLQQVENLGLTNPPGKVFTYSDINMIALGHLVEIISGEPINRYAQEHIFGPIGMHSATYLPAENLKSIIAPTYDPDQHQIRWGVVNDPTTFRMGGVSGMAGLFANANDVSLFAETLLNNGKINQKNYLLGPLTVYKMTTPQTPGDITDLHGLGWDIDTDYSNRGVLLPTGSYGHTGWTGTSLWIDPITHTAIIILTSRTYPEPVSTNKLISDRRAIANIVAGSLDVPISRSFNTTGLGELQRAYTTNKIPTQ